MSKTRGNVIRPAASISPPRVYGCALGRAAAFNAVASWRDEGDGANEVKLSTSDSPATLGACFANKDLERRPVWRADEPGTERVRSARPAPPLSFYEAVGWWRGPGMGGSVSKAGVGG